MPLFGLIWSPKSDLKKVASNDPSFTEVYWYNKGIGDDEVIQLAEALRENTHVAELWLGENKINDAGVKALAEVLRSNATITHLTLWNNKITDAGAKALAKMLQVNATVTKLDLENNKITGDGAKALAKVLEVNATVTKVNLQNNKITGDGAKALAKMLRANGTITTLWLDRNKISADLTQKFHQLVKINKESTSLEDARRRKKAEFGPPPRQAAKVTPSLPSKGAKSEGAEARTVAKPPVPSQDVVATPSGRGKRGERAHTRSEQEQRDRELAERLQREEDQRASPMAHAAAVNRGMAAAAGTRARPAAAAGAVPPSIPPMHAHGQSLKQEEQEAVALLAKNIVDFDRSLESVRGLPESLAGAAPEAQRYFLTFAAAFERAYVAAQALASGAVKVQLSGMKDQMLEGVLKALGDVAGASNIPFLGMISIVASAITYPRETRQLNVLSVFQDFFRGGSRDQYIITYRRLAEQICLRVDFASYASDVEGQKHDKQRLKEILQPIRQRLESAHFLQLENVQPIDDRAAADLAEVTESVIALRLEDENKFESLKAGPEEERVRFLLEQLKVDNLVPHCYGGTQSDQAFQRPRQTAIPDAQDKESSEPAKRSEPAKDAAWFQEIEREIERLRQDNRQHKTVQTRLRRLEEKVGSERDITTSGGGNQVQAQLLRSRNARSRHGGAAQASTELDYFRRDVNRELREIRETVAAQSEQCFISNRVLTKSEAFQLIDYVLVLADVEVSTSGTFAFDGKRYKIGCYCSRMFSGYKNIWKGKTEFKINQVYDGAKPVSYWFEKNGLEYVYEKNVREAIRKLFAEELNVDSASAGEESVNVNQQTEQERRGLFCNN